jgi:NADH-quinone oxidoreductase subunit J
MVEQAVTPLFWVFGFVIVLSALMVVSLKNIFHCALMLIVCLAGVAAIYILLHAEFLAAAQLLIYVGAVSVLMIFAVMLTSQLTSHKIVQTNKNAMIAFLACLVFSGGIILLSTQSTAWLWSAQELPANNVETIGKLLMTEFMLPFEVVSVLMLAALIGAIVLAREEKV